MKMLLALVVLLVVSVGAQAQCQNCPPQFYPQSFQGYYPQYYPQFAPQNYAQPQAYYLQYAPQTFAPTYYSQPVPQYAFPQAMQQYGASASSSCPGGNCGSTSFYRRR